VNSVPALRSRFLAYGPRSTPTPGMGGTTPNPIPQESKPTLRGKEPSNGGGRISRLLDVIASIQVPRSWFTHFYLVSVGSSLFWAMQILLQGRVFDMVLAWQQDVSSGKEDGSPGMTADQVAVMWLLMMMQGARRLYESVLLTKPSQSKMGWMHWLLGMGFYLVMGIAIWVEGIRQ
jgi:3-oxo-5-alpha-steroid 4-dehydrogenase 3